MKRIYSFIAISIISQAVSAHAIQCSFDTTKQCSLMRNMLTDKNEDGLNYFSSTNYDHRKSGEINVYDSSMVQHYWDEKTEPGQLKLLAHKANGNYWISGEFMTRANLTAAPYYAPNKSIPWTTNATDHGYIEVTARLPKCDSSDDGLCEKGTNPPEYNTGLWPAIWMLPSVDQVWPTNGEIDIMEAYPKNTAFNVSTAALHFNGQDKRCTGGDCKGPGFRLISKTETTKLYDDFHTWGFEWEKDPNSAKGGYVITGYFDNQKIWGPMTTDSLPADGPNALSRGFNDKTNGGYYLIVNLAVGGPYAGAPNSHMKSASMLVRSVKAYDVKGSSIGTVCKVPANVTSTYSADRKKVTLSWQQPGATLPITKYQVKNWQQALLWEGADLTWTESTLPGKPGTYTYYINSQCGDKVSELVKHTVVMTKH